MKRRLALVAATLFALVLVNLGLAKSLGDEPVSAKLFPLLTKLHLFDLDWFALGGQTAEQPPLNQMQAQTLTTEIDQAFDQFSYHSYRFKFGSEVKLSTGDQFQNVNQLDQYLVENKLEKAAPSDIEKIIYLGVRPLDKTIGFAGQGEEGGKVILVNGLSGDTITDFNTLVHEIGHTLGLGHSNLATCQPEKSNDQTLNQEKAKESCSSLEYGDSSSTMGSYLADYATNQPLISFTGNELWKLGLLNSDQVETITSSGNYQVNSLYPYNYRGIKLLILKIDSQAAVSIEYQPAIGPAEALCKSEIDIKNLAGYCYHQTPTYGLLVRYLASFQPKIAPDLPEISGNKYGDSFLIANQNRNYNGLQPGDFLTLSNGAVINFLPSQIAGEAEVAITFPK